MLYTQEKKTNEKLEADLARMKANNNQLVDQLLKLTNRASTHTHQKDPGNEPHGEAGGGEMLAGPLPKSAMGHIVSPEVQAYYQDLNTSHPHLQELNLSPAHLLHLACMVVQIGKAYPGVASSPLPIANMDQVNSM